MAKHKHYDFIVAWANGATIQMRCDPTEPWYTLHNVPLWNPETEYRVKPETREYRVGITSDSTPLVARDKKHAEALENCGLVRRWTTDWIKYEV